MICLVDLGTYCQSQGHWRIKDGIWNCVQSFSCCVTRNGLSCQVTWQVMWPPHGHRHTATATRPSYPWPGHVPGHVMSYVLGCVGTFDHGNLPRPLALWHPWPLLPFGPWPLFPRGQYPSSTMADGGLRLLAALGACGALGPWRPPTYGGLWPMGHPWPR